MTRTTNQDGAVDGGSIDASRSSRDASIEPGVGTRNLDSSFWSWPQLDVKAIEQFPVYLDFASDCSTYKSGSQKFDQEKNVPAEETPQLRTHLRVRPKAPWRKYALLVIAAVIMFFGLSRIYEGEGTPSGKDPYRFSQIERSNFKVFTIATGRIEAVDAVVVSSQLSGQVIEISTDFNAKVSRGSPLARLDDKSFRAAVAESQARLAHAKASYDAALAKSVGAEARLEASRHDFERKGTLAKRGNVSAQELDQARAKMRTAESELSAARADESVQGAAIEMAQAALQRALIDLSRTVIRSPIDGMVIKRSVEVGQTVAVSMTAPELFTIARDLNRMRVHARVDEADIGQIRVGQNAQFSVDAFPNRTFGGRVVEIHRAPEMVQNVVTYIAVITAENRDLLLLPGMTALVRIATTERSNALLVPNAALRFNPEGEDVKSTRDRTNPGSRITGRPAYVWVKGDPDKLSRVDIGVGVSNGSVTEVVSGSLVAGQMVAVGTLPKRTEKTLFGIRLGF